MKKLLSVLLLTFLLSTNSIAGDSTKIKVGSGPLTFDDNDVKVFHIYLTEKLTSSSFKEKNLPGMTMQTADGKARYANYFFIHDVLGPYVWVWWNDDNSGAAEGGTFGCENGACKQFAKKNKIVWKGAKKKISRKISIEELKNILRELGLIINCEKQGLYSNRTLSRSSYYRYSSAVGVVAYGKYTTSAKITVAKQQHSQIVNFIKSSYAQCALGENYIVMKTCDYGGFLCNGLKVGKNSTPGEINRPCKSGSGSASNSSYHFVFHFNYSQMKNPYGLDGPTGANIGGKMKDQCCLSKAGIQEHLEGPHME